MLIRCGAIVACLFYVAAGVASSKDITASMPRESLDSLLTRLDGISRDHEMTTAKKAIVASEEIDKFNQQHKGQSLTVRLKIQDVVPYGQGHYVTANSPDLSMVQFPTTKFLVHLSKTEVMAITKDSVLVVTGVVRATNQPPVRPRSNILEPLGSVAFPLRANSGQWICLDSSSYRVETVATAIEKIKPAEPLSAEDLAMLEPPGLPSKSSGKTASKVTLVDKTKTDQTRGVEQIRAFFLKGIVEDPHSYGSRKTGPMTKTPSGSGSSYGSAHGRHNRIYTREELIHKLGNPSSSTSVLAEETWTYKCMDGVVRVRFKQLGRGSGASSAVSEKTKLEIKSVDTLPASFRHDDRSR